MFHRLRRSLLPLIITAVTLSLGQTLRAAAGDSNVDLPRYPSISPDGSRIVFSWRGDLFAVSADGGFAQRLTTHPADDLHSAFSADGSRIAFTSDRNGYLNIYLMHVDGTGIRQLTDVDRPCELSGFGVDKEGNEVVTLHSSLEGEVYRDWRPYMVSTQGGDLRRMHDAFGSYPAVSPDGRRVAFARGGYYDGWERRHYRGPEAIDTWIYDRDDASFRRLTEHEGNDGKAQWLDDSTLLYLSDRELDCVNLYRMSTEAGEEESTRLTEFQEDAVQDFSVAADAAVAVIMVWDTLYTLDLEEPGAAPEALSIRAVEDDRDNFELKNIDDQVSEAALSPDGQVMAVIAYGEVYVRNVEEDSPTRRITRTHAREQDVAWSPDGLKLYFSSDEGAFEEIYAATVQQTRDELREAFEETTGIKLTPKFEPEEKDEEEEEEEKPDGSADEPAPAAAESDPVSGVWQGNADVPDRGVVAWTLTLSLQSDNTVTGSFEGAELTGGVSGTFDPSDGSLDLSISTDEFVVTMSLTITNGSMTGTAVAGDLSVDITGTRTATPDDGEDTVAEGEEEEAEEEEDLPKELDPKRWHDALTFVIEPVVQLDFNARRPRPSPDGKKLAFRGTRGDLHIIDLETGETELLIEGWDAWIDWRWSPDSRHIAYAQNNLNFNSDIFIMPADGSSEAVNITKHPDNDESPRWSADGRVLSFISERVDEQYDVWLVFLDEDLEALTREELKDYFEYAANQAKQRKPLKVQKPEDEEPPASQPAEPADGQAEAEPGDEVAAEETEDIEEDIEEEEEEEEAKPPFDQEDLESAYRRVRRLTRLLGNERNVELTPGGDTVIFTAGGDTPGLYSVQWDGSEQKRLGGVSNVQHVSLTGDKLVTVSGGRAATVELPGGSTETVGIDDRIRIDLKQQASQKFREAARILGEQYYHPEMNGVDWEGLTEKYHDLAMQSRTADEFNWLANRFIGELNGSHLRISARSRTEVQRQVYGHLGTRHQRIDDGFEVLQIVEDSPAAKGPMALQIGDVVTAIDFEPIAATDSIESRLKDRVGKETVITVRRAVGEAGDPVEFHVLLTPISFGQLRQLIYEQWRSDNAKLVHELSDGRLGYIHIQGMSQPSLDVFERDLFAAAYDRDGLVLDVRNNGGGWTTDRVLASIMVTPHAYTLPRGAPRDARGHYPQDRLFIQRYSLPMNLICNEKSFSNAEIMSHAFKTLNRGTLVGEQTYGGVISTGGWSLIDGTFVRMPFRGWYVAPTETDMELNGAIPDIHVPQTPQAESAGEDEQLRTAVEDLLKRLDEQ